MTRRRDFYQMRLWKDVIFIKNDRIQSRFAQHETWFLLNGSRQLIRHPYFQSRLVSTNVNIKKRHYPSIQDHTFLHEKGAYAELYKFAPILCKLQDRWGPVSFLIIFIDSKCSTSNFTMQRKCSKFSTPNFTILLWIFWKLFEITKI